MLTARTFCLAVGMVLLASCGSERDTGVMHFHGMAGLVISVEPISVAPGDHVDVVMVDKRQEIVVLQNMEVLAYDRHDNLIDSVTVKSTEEDRDRFMQEMMQGPQDRDLFKPFQLRKL
jgi:hypothetical protein